MERNAPILYQEPEGELAPYCASLNSLIRQFAVIYGKQSASSQGGTTHAFFDGLCRCIYFDSFYGNDRYSLEIVRDRSLVQVYSLVDKVDRQVINLLLPGDWLELLRTLQSEYGLV